MSADTLKRLSAARTALVLDHPFFGALALKLTPIECDDSITKTMATDGRSLFYNVAFVDSMSDQHLVGLYAHEVMHPAMQHHTRREDRDPERWNIAADHAINPLIIEAGMTLPPGALLDPQYAGLSAEQIYSKLPPPTPGDQQPGEVLDAPEPSQDAAEWQVAVKQATAAAQMMGHLPASLKIAVEQQTASKVDWKALLRRFVQQTAASDYSWKLPNRRYMSGGIYLPELRSETMPPIVVAVDTSGSTSAFIPMFAAELQAIVDECRPESTYVIYCDAEVQRVDHFERGEPVEMHVEGGGGTRFDPPFDYVDVEQLSPSCFIYLTDGEGRFPESIPDYPVLWAMTGKIVAPWGESLQIEEGV